VALAQSGLAGAEDAAQLSPIEFQSVTFSELLGVPAVPGLGFDVEIPAYLRERRSSSTTTGTLLWAEPADWSRIRNGRGASGRSGLIVVQRSGSLHYDEERDEFLDGTGLDERNLPERLGKQGASRVVVRRVDREGVPILLLESELKGGEHLRVLFVQLGSRARVVSYIGHSPWNALDDQAWARLRDAVAGGP
jgi:hypothetical protein